MVHLDSIQENIRELEEELSKTKYNKKSQTHVGLIKAKIALLKEKRIQRGKGKGKQEGYAVKKSGDGTVILVGFPSVGKSTLLNALTNAQSKVAAYAFTTLTVIPGLLEYGSAKIQVLDVPGIVEGAASGRGRGKEVLACAMSADLVIILLDIFNPQHLDVIKKEVYDYNLRLNEQRPDIKITRKPKGGLSIGSTVPLTWLDKKTVQEMLKEFKINNADVVIRTNVTADQLIDVIEGSKKYIPSIVVVNKTDLATVKQIDDARRTMSPDLFISAERGTNIDELKELIFRKLNFIRIYCKETGKKADLDEPMIMFRNATLKDMCEKLHRDFVKKFRFARIWGKSVKYPGMQLRGLQHKLEDGDVVELHTS